jgi:MEMO1 family protein
MMTVRPAAVAGMFYPGDQQELQALLQVMLADNPAPDNAGGLMTACRHARALIVPHAGYVYSGPIAATAYNTVRPYAQDIHRVVLLGPSHRVGFRGIAMPQASHFKTPLGTIALDIDALKQLAQLPQVGFLDQAHAQEHSLEVQLPFLQTVLPDFALVPLVVGDASPQQVQTVIEQFVADPHTLIVISTDLSHYLPYQQAGQTDRATIAQIESFSSQLQGEQACGCRVLNGFLLAAKAQDWQVQLLDYRNSGDTAGSRDRVVGYAAFSVQ